MSNFERVLQRWRKHRCIRPAPPRHLRVSSLVNRRRPATATNLHHLQLDCTTLLVPLVRKSTLFFLLYFAFVSELDFTTSFSFYFSNRWRRWRRRSRTHSLNFRPSTSTARKEARPRSWSLARYARQNCRFGQCVLGGKCSFLPPFFPALQIW